MTRTLPLPLPDPALVDGDLLLRAWQPGDAAALAAAWDDPEIAKWTGAPDDRSVATAARWIAGEGDRRSRGLALDLVVAVDGSAVGEVGITRFDRERHVAEIGWWTAPSHRGRGVASRAVRLVAGWAVTELCIERVYARVAPGNEASRAVAANAGFERRGVSEDGSEIWSSRLHPAEPVGGRATVPS